jgi:hypothetical protein
MACAARSPNRSAFRRMKPVASRWSYADASPSIVAIFGSYRLFWASAADDDHVAFVKLQTYCACDIALGFYDQRLKSFAFRRKAEAVVDELAVFRNAGVARVHSHRAATIAADEWSPSYSGRSRHQVQSLQVQAARVARSGSAFRVVP